jgi:hypothetical protein
MLGNIFVDKCLQSEILTDPWAHTVTKNHIGEAEFANLRQQCEKLLDIKMKDMPTHKGTTENQIPPKRFKEFGIDWYDEIYDISKKIYENRKQLADHFEKHRWYDDLCVTAYIGVQPPKPYKHEIHDETASKIWSSVTYITPDVNCGTMMYTENSADTLVKEAPWTPNSTMIFCGVHNETCHSYESTEDSNRVTLNFFIKQKKGTKDAFYSG